MSDIYSSAHDFTRHAMFHLKKRPPRQTEILTDDAIDRMQGAFPPGNTR